MIFLLAYKHNNGILFAVNSKGQFVGSESIEEAVAMLPINNFYSQSKLRDDGNHVWMKVYRTVIVEVSDLAQAFRLTLNKIEIKTCAGKTMYYKEVPPEFKKLILEVNLIVK